VIVMSLSRSPIRNALLDINRKEDAADARKTRNIIAILCVVAAFMTVLAITARVFP
jgi:hypothetical protein